MSAVRIGAAGRLRRGVPAVAVLGLVSVAALAGGGRAVAQSRGGPGLRPDGHAAAAGVISTIAGGVGGPGRATRVDVTTPCGVSFGGGRLYIADTSVVRKVNPQTDWLTTPAGAGWVVPVGDGGPAANANLQTCGAAVDHDGNLVIADYIHHRVRVVAARSGTFYGKAMAAGHIYAVAGNGSCGFSGDDGPATRAELCSPNGVAVDAAGNLVIADTGNSRVRVVAARSGTFYGQPMTAGHIYTVAGNGTEGFSGDGGPATGAGLNSPAGVAVDGTGNLVIADAGNSRVRVVAARSGTFYGQPMTAGHIYTVAGNGGCRFAGDGGPATATSLCNPQGVAVDGAGNLVIADAGNSRVRVVAARSGRFYGQPMTAGHIYTVAGNGTAGFSGDGRPATRAELNFPQGVAVDGAGNLVIADNGNSRVRVVAARSGRFYGQAMTAGHIYTGASNGAPPGGQEGEPGFSGDGGPATRAELGFVDQAVVDGAGNLVIADTGNDRIRVVAARSAAFYGQPMTAGHIYTVAGNGTRGFSGDGGRAASAELASPGGAVVDGAGNLVIADTGNDRIRVVAARSGTFYGQPMTAGHIYTVAGGGALLNEGGPATKARLKAPGGVAVDGAGNLVITDTGDERVRVVAARPGTFYGQAMTAGHIYAVAGNGSRGAAGDGGPATRAQLNSPEGVAVDGAGHLLIADTGNSRVRVVAARPGTFYGQPMTAGDIYTVAGNGGCGFSGDGGPGTATSLCVPNGVAADGAGNLLIADTDNDRIRVVAARPGTFYGQPMTAGHIYTVAGNGAQAFSGDHGPATAAGLNLPMGVAVNSAGNLLIADTANHRIRIVTG